MSQISPAKRDSFGNPSFASPVYKNIVRKTTVSIIIVSYNTKDLLKECLSSVFDSIRLGKIVSEVIIVDNASSDGSIELVEKNFPDVTVIKNNKNIGFAAANNQGIRNAEGEFLLLLNSDTVIDRKTLAILIEAITAGVKLIPVSPARLLDGQTSMPSRGVQKVGVVGPQIRYADNTNQPSAGYFPSLLKIFFWMTLIDDIPFISTMLKPYHVQEEIFYKDTHEVDWVTGACMLVSKEALTNAGLLDERIFMYGEEVEWCYRIKKAGFQIIYTPETYIYHMKGASGSGKEAGIIEEFEFIRQLYSLNNPLWQQNIVSVLLWFGAWIRLILFGIIARNRQKAHIYAQILKTR